MKFFSLSLALTLLLSSFSLANADRSETLDVIRETGFMQLELGKLIPANANITKGQELSAGCGLFFHFLNDEANQPIAKIHPGKEANTIGAIEILSDKYSTEEGIHIGSTLEELIKVYPKSETILKNPQTVLVFVKDLSIQFEAPAVYPSMNPNQQGIDLNSRITSIVVTSGC